MTNHTNNPFVICPNTADAVSNREWEFVVYRIVAKNFNAWIFGAFVEGSSTWEAPDLTGPAIVKLGIEMGAFSTDWLGWDGEGADACYRSLRRKVNAALKRMRSRGEICYEYTIASNGRRVKTHKPIEYAGQSFYTIID